MNKKQIEIKRLFWKMVEVTESCSDTAIRNEKSEIIERGMTLANGSVMFGVNDGTLNVYVESCDDPVMVFTENSQDLLILKDLFEELILIEREKLTPKVTNQEQSEKFVTMKSDMNKLAKIPTKELVEELKTREGVESIEIEPHKDTAISICGPAIVLEVID
ncbi:MAG: BC1881 family protein [Clostridiaceae bacterium]